MVFTKQNIKVTVALTILIIALLWCNIKKLYKSMIKSKQPIRPLKTKTKDKFYNTPETTTANTPSRFNEIVYGMNPNCLKDKQSPDANKLCPGSHPNIPCSRVGCPGNNTKLSDDMKRDIYLYTYLTGLLESADVWEKDTDEYWYTTNWRAEGSV
jgi:hypothetical protein